jgi:hypothetical protein
MPEASARKLYIRMNSSTKNNIIKVGRFPKKGSSALPAA